MPTAGLCQCPKEHRVGFQLLDPHSGLLCRRLALDQDPKFLDDRPVLIPAGKLDKLPDDGRDIPEPGFVEAVEKRLAAEGENRTGIRGT